MRTFSIEEANRLVPFLQHTFEEVRAAMVLAAQLTEQLAARGDASPPGAIVPEELPADHRQMREARDEAVQRIREGIGSVLEQGIEVKRPDGLVDFPTRRSGRPVHLCWRFGETSISHWHELAEGFGGRRAIENPGRFEQAFLN
ncbi:DUF2203 domain-containing protein [Vulgatibacter sp.]|uniref:DUF2203 domain-containing protein n=1 Tax=Vulgatibacter sp. TaxID=1971226 RepID=UPI00356535DF